MGKQSVVSREARSYIKEQIAERGEVAIEEVVGMLTPHYCFDPAAARQRELENYARRLMRSMRSADGIRTVLAVQGSPGRFVDIEHCKDLYTAHKVVEQLRTKALGISRTLRKAQQKHAELAGQQTLFSASDSDGQAV